jgi:hypothetical protein
MQNAECRMASLSILHSAFCILHSSENETGPILSALSLIASVKTNHRQGSEGVPVVRVCRVVVVFMGCGV